MIRLGAVAFLSVGMIGCDLRGAGENVDIPPGNPSLDGAWSLVCYGDGAGVSNAATLKRWTWRLSGDAFEIFDGEKAVVGLRHRTKREKHKDHIDFSLAGTHWSGTYALDGDVLVISMPAGLKLPPFTEHATFVVLKRSGYADHDAQSP